MADCTDGNGRVYIFNTWDKTAQLQLNGASLGTVEPFSLDGPGTLNNNEGVCRFAAPSLDGVAQVATSNSLIVQRGSASPDTFDIEIDSTQWDLSDNLQLYIFDDHVALVAGGKLVGGALIWKS